MILPKLIIVSFCCLVCLSYFAQCNDEQGNTMKKDTKKAAAAAIISKQTTKTAAKQSSIYKIKRLDTKGAPAKQRKPQKQLQHNQPELQEGGSGTPSVVAAKPPRTKKFKNLTKNSHGLNKKLLNKLGFTKVKAPNSHNRKRLAIESRRHASPDDSHMFIIKLPPNLYYYTSPKAGGGGGEANPKNALIQQPQHHQKQQQMLTEAEVLNANGKKVSFPFNSNGKPGRIYHWNLPAIKKILEDKQRFPNVAAATKDQLIDIKGIPTWAKPWENETIEKSYGKSGMMSSYKKSLKRKSPSYYAPANAVNKNSFNKYFSGNGKPKGFYVIKENQKKPLYYKNIVS